MCCWTIQVECPTNGCKGISFQKAKYYPRGHLPCPVDPNDSGPDYDSCNSYRKRHVRQPQNTAQHTRLCTDCLARVSQEDKHANNRGFLRAYCKVCRKKFRSKEQCEEHVNARCRQGAWLYHCMLVRVEDIRKAREPAVMLALARAAAMKISNII